MAQEHTATNDHGEHETTSTGLSHRKMLMWAFLGSDCMFFGSLIATYLVYQGKSLSGPLPIDVFDIPVTSVSTFVLLMSSMSMVLAYSALNRGNMKAFRIWMGPHSLVFKYMNSVVSLLTIYTLNVVRWRRKFITGRT